MTDFPPSANWHIEGLQFKIGGTLAELNNSAPARERPKILAQLHPQLPLKEMSGPCIYKQKLQQ